MATSATATTRLRLRKHLAERAAAEIADGQTDVAEHHGPSRVRQGRHAHGLAELGRERDEDPDDVPDRHADEDHARVAAARFLRDEQRPQVAARHRRLAASTISNKPDSATPMRSASRASPMPPPMKYAMRQSVAPPTSAATTAPRMPTEATTAVPHPRVRAGMISLTSVMPAPSSPARPMPATRRSHAYCSTVCDEPVRDVGERVHHDRSEQHRQPAPLVAEHAPERPANAACRPSAC